MFEVIEGKGLYYKKSEDQEVEALYTFRPKNEITDNKYIFYFYVEIIDGILYGKFGESIKQTPYERNSETGSIHYKHIIALWEKEVDRTKKNYDLPIHNRLKQEAKYNEDFKWAGEKETCQLNTNEAYIIKSPKGLKTILEIISKEVEAKPITKTYRPDWDDIVKVANEVVRMNHQDFILDLCTRWGKTSTVLNIILQSDERLNIMCSYVGTVRTSYSEDISSYSNYDNILFVDPDNFESPEECIDTCKEWLKVPEHKVFYYLALTGGKDTCFDRRSKGLESLRDEGTAIFIEEADYGATCDLQAEKLKDLKKKMKYKKLYFTTGTSAEKCESLTKNAYRVYRDYMVDVLAKRDKCVKINWQVLNNTGLIKNIEGYTEAEMENFSEMFTVVDGKLKGEAYFRELFTFLFKKINLKNTKATRNIKDISFIDPNAATMVFTPMEISSHEPLKKIIEQVFDHNAVVVILNGDKTSNKEAEAETKLAIKNANGKPVFIISGGMATRSYSIPQIKNIILLSNSGSFATVQQKIARGLTPWNDEHDTCNIIDFRMDYLSDSNLKKYLETMAINKIEDDEWTGSLIEGIEACGKLTFFEYFEDNIPIRKLSKDELKGMMETLSYNRRKARYIFSKELPNIRSPKFKNLNEKFDNLKKSFGVNIKGSSSTFDHFEKHTKKPSEEEKAEKKEHNQKLQHLAFLFNHPTFFDRGVYTQNIILNEFSSLTPKMISTYEESLEIDMGTMSDIVFALAKNYINLDSILKEE